VAKRVSPIDRVRAQIDQLFAASERPLAEILEDVGRLSVLMLMQRAVEAAVEAFLSRARYERREEDGPAGDLNQYQPPATVETTMGPVELQRSKLPGNRRAARYSVWPVALRPANCPDVRAHSTTGQPPIPTKAVATNGF
jgi:hypothetical protein